MKKTVSRQRLGFWSLTALVCGNMIGSGVFLLPSSLAKFGSISIISWLCTATGAILLGLVMAKLGSAFPKTGGPYAYCEAAFGDFIGFQIAYGYWIAMWVGNAAIAIAFVGYLAVFFPILTQNHLYSFFAAAAAVWFLTFVNLRGVRQAGMVQLVTTALKLLPLFAIGLFGFFFADFHYLQPFNATGQSHFSAISGAATLTLWAFIGLESATVPADSVENPKRNIPRATLFGILLTAVLYILCMTAVMLMVPNQQLLHSTAPFADAAKIMFGPWGEKIIAIGAIISTFGTLNGWILMQAQIPMAAAKDHLFPKLFGKTNKAGAPANALIISSICITLLLLLTLDQSLVTQFTYIILLATFSSIIPYFFTCIAQLILFVRKRELFEGTHFLRASVITVLAALYAYWAVIGSGQQLVFYGMLLLLSSLPFYALLVWRQARA
ncbi:MAG: amino acid permease [Gammaproteobacteria bacterium]|nr:amino acid permease [Gammaproteobacteria bacterium]